MSPRLKCYADYFSMGLQLELCSVDEVVAWADRLIEESDRPSDWMIDLSTSTDKHFLDIIHVLHLVPGIEDLDTSFRLLIAKMGNVHPILLPQQDRLLQLQHHRLFRELYFLVREQDSVADEVRYGILLVDEDIDSFEFDCCDWSTVNQDYQKLLAVGDSYKEFISFFSV